MRPSSSDLGGKTASIATGGMMRMGWGRTAIAILASALLGISGCASRRAATNGAAEPNGGSSATSSTSGASSSVKVTRAAFDEDSDGARLVLSADAPLLYTAYEPRPDVLVIDMLGITLAWGLQAPGASGTLVSSVQIAPVSELGRTVTRLTVHHREGLPFA